MSFEKPLLQHTRLANADLSTNQFYAVKINSSDKVALCDTAGEFVQGILQNDPTANQNAELEVKGITKAIAGGTIALGDPVSTASTGKLVKSANAADYVLGRALAAAVTNDIFPLIVTREGRVDPKTYSFSMPLVGIATGTTWSFTPGFAGTILAVKAVPTVIASTGGKAATMTLKIGTTAVTSAALAMTTTTMGTLGTEQSAAATGANTFLSSDTLNLVASAVTAFVEGHVTFTITYLQAP